MCIVAEGRDGGDVLWVRGEVAEVGGWEVGFEVGCEDGLCEDAAGVDEGVAGEVGVVYDSSAGGTEEREDGVEDLNRVVGWGCLGDVDEVAWNADAGTIQGGKIAGCDVVRCRAEWLCGCVVVGVEGGGAGDDREEVSSVFDATGHRSNGVLMGRDRDNEIARCQADSRFDTHYVVQFRRRRDAAAGLCA